MASKTQQQKGKKPPDYKAKGKQLVVKYLQPRWWRWNAQVVIAPTFSTRWQTAFRAKAIRFSGKQVEQVDVRKPSWGNPGFIHFQVDFNDKQRERFAGSSVSGVNRLRIVHNHWQHGGLAQILSAGQQKYGWKVVTAK